MCPRTQGRGWNLCELASLVQPQASWWMRFGSVVANKACSVNGARSFPRRYVPKVPPSASHVMPILLPTQVRASLTSLCGRSYDAQWLLHGPSPLFSTSTTNTTERRPDRWESATTSEEDTQVNLLPVELANVKLTDLAVTFGLLIVSSIIEASSMRSLPVTGTLADCLYSWQ